MAPSGQGEGPAEEGERGENTDVEGTKPQLVEHEDVVKGAEAIGGEGPNGAEGDEDDEGTRGEDDAKLFLKRQGNRGRVGAQTGGNAPEPTQREDAHEDSAGDDDLENANGVVPVGEGPAGDEKKNEGGDLESAVAPTEILAANPGRHPVLDPCIPSDPRDGSKKTGDKEPRNQPLTGDGGAVRGNKREGHAKDDPGAEVEGRGSHGDDFGGAPAAEWGGDEYLQEITYEGQGADQADGG